MGQGVSAITGSATAPAGAAVAQTAGAAASEAAGAATSTLTSGSAQTATGGALSDAAGAATSALTEHATTPAGGALADTTGAAPSISTADTAATPAGGPVTEEAGTLSSAPADQGASTPSGEALAEDAAGETSAPATEGEAKPGSEALASDSSDTAPARAAEDASQAPAEDAGQADAAAQTPGDTTVKAPGDAAAAATSSPETAGATPSAQDAVEPGALSGAANIAAAQAPATSPEGAPAPSAQGPGVLGAALDAAMKVPAAAAAALNPLGVAAGVAVVAAAGAATSAVAAIAKQATRGPGPSTQAPAEASRPGEQSPARDTAGVYSLGSDATVEQNAANLAGKEGHRRVSFGELGALGAQDKLTIVAHGGPDRFGGLTPGGLAAHLKDAGVSALGTLSLKGCDSADFARDLQLELQKQGIPVDRITGRNDLVTITKDGRTLVHDGNQWLHQAPGAKTEVRPAGDGGVLASDPYAANDPAAADARSQPLREAINAGSLNESFSYSAADIKAFSKSTPEPGRIEKDLKSLLKDLETQKLLSAVNLKTRARTLDPGYFSFLQQKYAGDPALLDAAIGFIAPRLARHSNVAEASRPLNPGTKSETYRDWVHQFGNTVSLLSTSNLPKPAMTKLLRFSLMQHQLNATYSAKDNAFLSRQTSPIALPGYGRGMRTGLWEAAAQVLNGQLTEQLPPKSKLDRRFYLLPVSAPLTSFGPYTTAGEVTPDINSQSNVYIPSLGVQLIKIEGDVTKKKIDAELGARGLRKSPGESAAIVADAMAGMIKDGKVDEAVTLIRKVVDANKDAKDVKQPLKQLELRPNTLAVSTTDGKAIDPLSNSPKELLDRVEDLYTALDPQPTDPFYVRQNLEVVKGLLGPDITSLFDSATPSMISAELADTLTDVHDLIEQAREGMDDATISLVPADNLLIEKLYQAMQRVHDLARFQLDWKGEPGPTLEDAVRGLLPQTAPEPQAVLSRPHALAMINDISAALGDDARSVAILKGAYYETPHLFPKEQQHVDSVTDAALKDKKVIVLEPHPNNAAETEIHPHNVLDLFNNLFGTETSPHTVVLDLTLSHLSEPEVATILDAAQQHIESGKLNLVLVQSGTKFYQSGMDIVNVGTAITFNNGGDTWNGFNDATKNTKNPLPAEDQAYVARMLDRNGQQLMDYLDKIRSNTAELRDLLTGALGKDSAFTLSESTDPTTVYVAFRPTDAFIAQTLGKSVEDLTFDDRMAVNQDVYSKHVLPALEAATLPAVDRTSFGFNVTNFGECATTVRITPGIEDRSFFESYSKVVAGVGAKLAAELQASQPAVSSADAELDASTATPKAADALADPSVDTGKTAELSEPGGQPEEPGRQPQEPGGSAVYSLGADTTVQQNAENLAGKDGHRRVSLGELGALGAQDKLTMVAHGAGDRFGGLKPGELAAHLKNAGVSALGTLSLKGCDSAAFARDLMRELQKLDISVNRITGRNGQVTITKDGRTLVDSGQGFSHHAPGAKSDVRPDDQGGVVARDPYAANDPAAAEARSQPLRENINTGALSDAFSFSAADIKAFSKSTPEPARIEKDLKSLLKDLETQKWLSAVDPKTRARTLDPGYHSFLQQTYAGDPALLNAALDFIGSRLARHGNVAEAAQALDQGTKLETYRDWFHQLGHTVSLLATSDLPEPAMAKLLRFSLMQYQLNATYSAKDNKLLSRQTSPIALPGYGRGMRTGLWNVAAQVLKDQLAQQLQLDSKFYVLPVSAPMTSFGPYHTAAQVTPDINSLSNVYIPWLGVQLIKIGGDITKPKVDSELGALGLRKSPGESATIVAEAMARMIKDGKVDEAFGLIQKVAEGNKDAKGIKKPMTQIELRPNTLLVSTAGGQGMNPLHRTPAKVLQRVKGLYAALQPKPTDPFYVRQNLEVMRGLLGSDITSLFDSGTPSMISAELADTLADVGDLVAKARDGAGDPSTSQDPADNLLVEKLYQAMQRLHDLARFQIDWSGEPGPTLDEAVRGLLPRSAPEPRAVLSKPHALAMIHDIAAALGDDAQSVAILKGAYYETPHLFPGEQRVDSVTDAALKDKRVIVLEPHPNNAAETEIHPHNVLDLFQNLFGTDTGPHSVVLDLTLSHLSEPEVATILDAAQQHIQSGMLNLVLVQSGTKFYQSGMDIVNLGTAITFNDGGAAWQGFNEATEGSVNPLPAEDQAYVARMLDRNGQQLMDYLDKIRSNTAELRDLLTDALGQNSAFTLSESTDPTTVYVAFRPTDAFIAQRLGKSVNDLSFADRMKVNQDVYKKHVLPALEAATLPAVDRTSFGFNVTNFGECATTVRITPGIEGRPFFEAYSKVVADIGKKLAAEMPPPQPATSSGVNAASETTPGTPKAEDARADAGVKADTTAELSEPGGEPEEPGVKGVYSLGTDATVEQNAENLAGKAGHHRVAHGELGALGAQDKLTMVAHGDADHFGALTPEQLAAHLKNAGVSALRTLSLKGCDSESFARKLMTELQNQGISVNKITGRNGEVTITKDGQTLVRDGQRWFHKSPGTKSAVQMGETGGVSARDPYELHDAGAAAARSAPLSKAINAGSLTREADNEGGAASEIDQILDEIEAMDGSSHFPHLDTAAIAAQLRERLDRPYRVDQGNTGLCGAAAFTSTLAETKPEAYVRLARDLLKEGKGKVGALSVNPGDFVRGFDPRGARVEDADWLVLASIRNDTSAALMDKAPGQYGGAKTYAVYGWLKQAGYRQVHFIPADKKFSTNQGSRGLFAALADQFNAVDAWVASRWHPSPPSFLEGKTSAELADPRKNVALAKSFLAHNWSLIGQISEKYANSTGGGIDQRLAPYVGLVSQAQLDQMRETFIKEFVGSGTDHWAVVKQVELNAGSHSSLEARLQRYSWGEERWTAALAIKDEFELMYGGFIAFSDAPGANLESWDPAPSTRADPDASTGWPPGVGAVYSLGLDPVVEQNAANLAGKPGHRRVWRKELGALGAQDKLTLVGHGAKDGVGFAPGDLAGPQDDARFGGFTPGELAAFLKDAGVSALGTLSLKGCNSADFARDLMVELRQQGISVNKVTGRNDLVTITKDGHTLVREGERWMHQAPGAKAEVRLDRDGEVIASDAYAHHDVAAAEARSEPLRERRNADPLNDDAGAPEGGRPGGAGKVARGLKKIIKKVAKETVAQIKGDRPSAPPPAESQGESYLDPNKLIAAREDGAAMKKWNPTHREWYLDQATLLDAYQGASDAAVRKQLALLMMHSFYKVATIDQDKANLQERQISPFLPQPYRYHRSTQSSLLDRVHVAYESALGFRPPQAPAQASAFQVTRPQASRPEGVLHLVDNPTFKEVLAREYVTRDLAADTRVNDLAQFRRTVRDLLGNVDDRPQISSDDKVLFDASALLEGKLGGGTLTPGAVGELVSDLETSFLEEVASFLADKQGADGFDQGQFLKKLAQVLAGTQVAAFTQHVGHTLLVTPHFLERRPAGGGALGALPEQQVTDLFSHAGSKHRAFTEELQASLSKSGYRVDPITAKEAWLDVESVEAIFAQEGIPLTTLGTKGSGIAELHATFDRFLGSQTLRNFEALAGRHPQRPYVSVLSQGTADLLRGLGRAGSRDIHAVFQEKGLQDLLQTSYHRIETAMREAMVFANDFSRFLNQIEVIHQQIQAILEIVSPYGNGDFASGLLRYLGDVIPEGLTPSAEVYPSAMHTVASTLAAVEALKGDNALNIAVLKDSYYESSMALDHARTYELWSLDGDALRGGQALSASSLEPTERGREDAGAPPDLKAKRLDVFLGELRHNISANRDVYAVEDLAHEVDQLFEKGLVSDRFTVMIDNTIDHLRSDGIRRFLEHNAGRIKAGELNVVVFRSAQKFDMLGMDNYYGGFAFGVNDPGAFARFNARTRDPADRLKGLNRQGLTHLVKSAGASLDAYRSGIMANTRTLYDALPAGFKHDPSVTPGPNDTRRHMHVARIEGDDKQVFLDITFQGSFRDVFASQFNKFIRENGLPVDERSSFGFATSNLTTIAELGKIRFNPGLEGPEHRDRYVEFFTKWFHFIDVRLAAGKSVGDILFDLGTIGLDGGAPTGGAPP